MIDYLKANNVRAVIMFGYRYISYRRIIRYCHQAGIPLFVNNDSNIQNDRHMSPAKRWLKARMYRSWLRLVSGVMPMGELGDQFFVRYGANPQRLYRVPYTPDYESFAERDEVAIAAISPEIWPVDRSQILALQRSPGRSEARRLAHRCVWTIAAERPDWDLRRRGRRSLGDELRGRVPEPIRRRVIWTGFLEQDELKSAYHASDVLVLPSDFEPWAVVVQEAMAAGMVVVASDAVGSAHELIADGLSGRIFPPGDLGATPTGIAEGVSGR